MPRGRSKTHTSKQASRSQSEHVYGYKSKVRQLKRQRSKRLARLTMRVARMSRSKDKSLVFAMIADEFCELGGIYVKFLQGIMLNHKLMRQWKGTKRFKLFEELDTFPLNIRSVLHHELGAERMQAFAGIQEQPFAAGSFGQVYYGQLKSGKPVVVKVLKPMVREMLKYDIRILGLVTGYLKGGMTEMEVDFKSAYDSFRQATLSETDYVAEAQFAHEMFVAYRDHPTFIIPETFLELCTPNIIVQEFLPGLSMADIVKRKELGEDVEAYVREMIGSDLKAQLITLGEQIHGGAFFLKAIQGDPHPGNIRLQPGNRIGLIDFGVRANAPDRISEYYAFMKQYYSNEDSETIDVAALFANMLRFVAGDLYAALQRLGTLAARRQRQHVDLVQEIGMIVQGIFEREKSMPYLQAMIKEGKIVKAFNQVANKGNRFGLVARLKEMDLLRATQTYGSLVDLLGWRYEILPIVHDNVVHRVEVERPDIAHNVPPQMPIAQAVEVVSAWLERIAANDVMLFSQLLDRIRTVQALAGAPVPPKPAAE